MNAKTNLLVLLSCLTLAHQALTQENVPATNTPAATSAQVETNVPPAPPAEAAATTNPAPATFAEASTTNTTAPATNDAVASATTTSPTNATPTIAPTPTGTNSDIIPLIQFVDVPLTAAIENLARQANLNYILDPKINFGQAGTDGKVVALPSITIRWENLTALQALNAILKTYDLQIIDDPNSSIARIAPKDPAAAEPLVTKVLQLKYANPSNIVVAVQSTLIDKRSKVLPDVRTSQLVVVSTEKEMTAVTELVERLDTPTKQVLIEANLLETSRNPKTVKGIDWAGTLEAQNVTFGNGKLTGSTTTSRPGTPITTTETLPGGRTITYTTSPGQDQQSILNTVLGSGGLNWSTVGGFAPAIGFLNADGARAVLSFLNSENDTKVLSTPRTITLDNETAFLSVTRSNPVFQVSAGTQNTAGGSQTTYAETGTKLTVTPRISANNLIRLAVQPEISDVVYPPITRVVNGVVNEGDAYDVRRVQTQVLIPSGNTLVMGGLVSDGTSKGYSKVPVLGDMPGIGLAFRHESKSRSQRNLLIFITPTIVQDTDFQPAQSAFMQTPLPAPPSTKVSAWDAGQPVDWTKPFRKKSTNDE